MNPKTLIVAAALVAAFFVGWLVKPPPSIHSRTKRTSSDDRTIPRTEFDRLEAELNVERKLRADLEQRVEKLQTPDPEAAAGEPDAKNKTVTAPIGPRFHYGKYKDALRQVDWKVPLTHIIVHVTFFTNP